jgi:hypothetical protein
VSNDHDYGQDSRAEQKEKEEPEDPEKSTG